jgi:hypothetical protein
MRAVYLTGEEFYLRAMVLDDKDHAAAWLGSVLPVSVKAAEKLLEEAHEVGWDEPPVMHLAVVRKSDDEIIGGVAIEDQARRLAWLSIYSAPSLENGEQLRADVLRLVVPWLRDELEILVTRVEIPEDEVTLISAAEELGMLPATRLRQFKARASGRLDMLGYEALNPKIALGDGHA